MLNKSTFRSIAIASLDEAYKTLYLEAPQTKKETIREPIGYKTFAEVEKLIKSNKIGKDCMIVPNQYGTNVYLEYTVEIPTTIDDTKVYINKNFTSVILDTFYDKMSDLGNKMGFEVKQRSDNTNERIRQLKYMNLRDKVESYLNKDYDIFVEFLSVVYELIPKI